MKIMGIILSGLLGLTACSAKADSNASESNNDSRVLVAYFSATGTTKAQAEAIAKATNADLYEITPAEAYTDADLDWRNARSRSSMEMNDDNSRPALGGNKVDAAVYDVIFIGYPIWWDLAPRPVNTWIESQNLKDKKVIPFATSGGSSIDNSEKALRKLYPEAGWQSGRLLNGSASEAAEWGKSMVEK